MQPVPLGVPGEIYIGGVGIARGYLNNPELTREKFLPNPFVTKKENSTQRLYKTGDLGRWMPTGELECLGRLDEQVKIRGFRVELSEIECVIEKHPIIKKAIVVLKSSPAGNQIYAYILSKIRLINLNEIRQFLRMQLPSYMVPAEFFQIDELPLSPNGKVDKQKLLSLEKSNLLFKESRFSQMTELEEKIAHVIQSILGCKNVVKDQNFLDLGFDSISLIRLSTRLSDSLGRNVSIVELFTYPTIESLSTYLSDHNNQYCNPGFIKKRVDLRAKGSRAERILFIGEKRTHIA